MKTVILKSMTMINFKGHKNLTVRFGSETVISGENATGKSTVFDAFTWLLFGKDQFDRKDYEVIPTIDGKQLDRVDTEVSAIINVDGRASELRRVLRQKWVRKRGTSEEVFDGCETLFYISGVPKKAGEFKKEIDSIMEETIFKLITNPSIFLALHWTKQREFLFQMAGLSDYGFIIDGNPGFKILLDKVDAGTTEAKVIDSKLADYKKEISAKKKRLRDDLDTIPAKIDQTTKLMPENKDIAGFEAELKQVDNKLADLDLTLSDRAAAARLQYDAIQARQKQINDLKAKQTDLVNKAAESAKQAAFNENLERRNLVNKVYEAEVELTNLRTNCDIIKRRISGLEGKRGNLQLEIDNLRKRWADENAKEYAESTACLTCPIFGHECFDPTAIVKHEGANGAARIAFMEAKDKRLESINAEGIGKTGELSEVDKSITASNDEYSVLLSRIAKQESVLNNLKSVLNSTPLTEPAAIIPAGVPGYLELQSEIEAISATITEVKPIDDAGVSARRAELTSKRDTLMAEISKKGLIDTYNKEITKLKEQASGLAQQIADIEKQEFAIMDFTRAKIEECEGKINGLFQIVKFKLFDRTIEGNEFECCTATNKSGVPISATNTAERINAGLDIINTLSRFYNVTAPIFCDGSESVNTYLKAGSQMAFLKVTKEKVLTIN